MVPSPDLASGPRPAVAPVAARLRRGQIQDPLPPVHRTRVVSRGPVVRGLPRGWSFKEGGLSLPASHSRCDSRFSRDFSTRTSRLENRLPVRIGTRVRIPPPPFSLAGHPGPRAPASPRASRSGSRRRRVQVAIPDGGHRRHRPERVAEKGRRPGWLPLASDLLEDGGAFLHALVCSLIGAWSRCSSATGMWQRSR